MTKVWAGFALVGALMSFGAGTASADTIAYAQNDTTATIECRNGDSLGISGSNNTLTVTGSCSSAEVSGNKNRIGFNAITDTLFIPGSGNTVSVKGDPANLNIAGNDNTTNTGTG